MPMEGKVIILREERPEDMPKLAALRNDLDTQAWNITLPPDYTAEMYLKRFQGREFSYQRSDGRFIIIEKSSGEFAGMISYSDLQSRWSAMIGIMVDKKFWGSGLAYDAQEVLLKFLFQELGLRLVRIWTHSGNRNAVRLAGRSGFKVSGRMREGTFKNGELYDDLVVDLLREEYYALHPELVDNLPSPEIS